MSKITDDHVRRPAYLYIRQSTLGQVQHNRESQRRQYGLQERARQLGWQEVVVVDEDLGHSGAGTARAGFDRLLAAVCQGDVGAVFAIEASRLARNGRDWHTLLEFCGLVNTLLVDEDGIYDPRQPNDRLLLGLKGTLSEMELATFRQRSQEALKGMAARGVLYTSVAVGYRRTPDQRLEKEPHRRVQQSIELVFQQFRAFGSIRQVLLWLRQEGIELPAVDYGLEGRQLCWKLPVYNTIHKFLTNPIYAGAYAYGRTESRARIENGRRQIRRGYRRAQETWEVLILDHHEGYISWEEYQANQALIAENANGRGRAMVRGAVNPGAALLPGLLRCGHCGRKLTVQYSGKSGTVVRYLCRGALLNHGVGDPCLAFGGLRVDQAVTREVLEALQPLGLEAALEALHRRDQEADALRRQRQLALEQARFEAERVRRQYDAVEPENRLVAATLEHRWNEALRLVQQREQELAALQAVDRVPTEVQRRTLLALAEDLPTVWQHPASSPAIKKRLLRAVLKEIVVSLVNHRLYLVLHWHGGDHTELEIVKNRPGVHRWKTDVAIEQIIRSLARLMPDARLAALLNHLGQRTAKGFAWTRNRVCTFRNDHQIEVYVEGERQARGEMTLQEAADQLGVSPITVRRLIQRHLLPATQVCFGAPWVIHQDDLAAPAVQQALQAPQPGNDHQTVISFQ